MKIVSEESINKAIESLEHLDDAGIEALYKKIESDQPHVFGYIITMGDDLEEDAYQAFLDLALVIYGSFEAEYGKFRAVTEDEIVEIFNNKLTQLEDISDESDEDDYVAAAADSMLAENQSLLLQFVIEDLVAMEKEEEVGESEAAVLFQLLSVIITAMDQALNISPFQIVKTIDEEEN
jgi:hypothetical protein